MRRKGQLPTGSVPVWVTPEKKVLPHKDAILRYIGRISGYYPNGAAEAYDIDWTIDTLNDVWKDKFLASWISDKPPSKGEIQERVQDIIKLHSQLEGKLKDGRKWMAGKRISIADFAIAACYHSVVLNDHVKHESLKKSIYETLVDYPILKEWLKRISTELKDYLRDRPRASI